MVSSPFSEVSSLLTSQECQASAPPVPLTYREPGLRANLRSSFTLMGFGSPVGAAEDPGLPPLLPLGWDSPEAPSPAGCPGGPEGALAALVDAAGS